MDKLSVLGSRKTRTHRGDSRAGTSGVSRISPDGGSQRPSGSRITWARAQRRERASNKQ